MGRAAHEPRARLPRLAEAAAARIVRARPRPGRQPTRWHLDAPARLLPGRPAEGAGTRWASPHRGAHRHSRGARWLASPGGGAPHPGRRVAPLARCAAPDAPGGVGVLLDTLRGRRAGARGRVAEIDG